MAKKRQSAYSKELRRITRRIKALEKRGYFVPASFKEEIKTYSWQKLRTIKPRNIYSISQYATETGKVISGTEGRIAERKLAGLRAKITKRIKQARKEEPDTGIMPIDYILPDMGEVIYNRLTNLMESFPTAGKDYLEKMLNAEISRYGRNAVLKSLAQATPSQIREIEQEIYYEGNKSKHHRALKSLADLIKGTIETEQEAKEIGQVQDAITTYENPQ